ncbi:MAG: HNH endonuclease family protein, partial [Oscillospiraceae bacterium]|nr:HNH endonuclease family protein [Oscillospiraceae bacterium]
VNDVIVGNKIHKKEKDRAFKITLKDSAKGYPYHYNSKEIYLESDTANSLMRDFGDFIRIILKRAKGENWPEETYIKKYGLPENASDYFLEPFKFFYWYTLIPELKDLLEGKEKACFDALEERAALVHTLGNVILVPYGYNSARGYGLKTYTKEKKINDRLDLTMDDFEEMLTAEGFDDEQFYSRQDKEFIKKFDKEKTSVDAVRFLMNHQAELFPDIPKYPNPEERMTKIEWLTKVSEEIVNTLEKE